MKFGKQLISESTQFIITYFGEPPLLEYNTLKRTLKARKGTQRGTPPPVDLAANLEAFIQAITKELARVVQKTKQLKESLSEEVNAVVDCQDKQHIIDLYIFTQVAMRVYNLNKEGSRKIIKKLRKVGKDSPDALQAATKLEQSEAYTQLRSQPPFERVAVAAVEAYGKRWCDNNLQQAVAELEDLLKQDHRAAPRYTDPEHSPFAHSVSATTTNEVNRVRLVYTPQAKRLASDVSEVLKIPVEQSNIGQFANGEISVSFPGVLRGSDVFLICAHCGSEENPDLINRSVMETLLTVHTLRIASVARIIPVIPYLAYSRRTEKPAGRVPISCSALAQMLNTVGIDSLITVDLHWAQIAGFFKNTPVDDLKAFKEFGGHIKERHWNVSNMAVVSPDASGMVRAKELADNIGAPAVGGVVTRMLESSTTVSLVGNVEGKMCILFDDMIDTAESCVQAANLLAEKGATQVVVMATHGILTGNACRILQQCNAIIEVVVTDSLPQGKHLAACPKLHVLPIAPLLATAIWRIHRSESLSKVFDA